MSFLHALKHSLDAAASVAKVVAEVLPEGESAEVLEAAQIAAALSESLLALAESKKPKVSDPEPPAEA